MYLVELRPGKEELYRNGDDLALAIRGGEVDARSRIYHRATAKWISITLHPQYKAIVAAQQEKPAERPARKGWAGILQASLAGQEDPTSQLEPIEDRDILRHWKQPLWLGLTSILLVLGLHLAFSGAQGSETERAEMTERSERVAEGVESTMLGAADRLAADRDGEEATSTLEHEQGLISLADTEEWALSERPGVETAAPSVRERKPLLPRAPRLRSKALRAALVPGALEGPEAKPHSVEALLRSYQTASDSALARLEAGLRVARLTRLFAPSRLSPGGGVSQTRLSLAGAVNMIRVYREQQTAIEAVYQDSLAHLALEHDWTPKEVRQWYSRPQRKETPTLQLVSNTLIGAIDSILGVLDEQAGAYKIRRTAIAFENPAATKEYGALRVRIKKQIDSAVAAEGATSRGPTSLLLQAIGTSSLPRET